MRAIAIAVAAFFLMLVAGKAEILGTQGQWLGQARLPIWYVSIPGSKIVWKVRGKDSIEALVSTHVTVAPAEHYDRYPEVLKSFTVVDLTNEK